MIQIKKCERVINMTDQLLLNKLIDIRRELHRFPELSMKEYETTKRIKKWLKHYDISIADEFQLDVGAVAEIVGGKPGPIIAIRADIDALPIEEKTNLPFASEVNGVMHACGHDFHTASIIGAAILLKERQQELCGTVRFIFQPAEETASGAKMLVEKGVLEGVEAIFGMHNKPDLPVGTIGIKPGPLMASVDRFEIDVKGVGGHAGIPEKTIDPIAAAGQIVTSLQTIVSRNLSPFQNVVVSITQIHGGSSWNVIPDKVTLEGTVRTFQEEAREKIPALMKRTAEGIGAAFGASVDVKWYPYLPVVNNDDTLEKLVTKAAEDLSHQVVEAEQSPGGEDFAVYQQHVPGFFVWMGTAGEYEWHHPSFSLNEEALLVAASYFANLSFHFLNSFHYQKN